MVLVCCFCSIAAARCQLRPRRLEVARLTCLLSSHSVVISVFAIVILGTLGLLFKNNHHELVGGVEDPENGPEVAGTIFVAVLVYAVRPIPGYTYMPTRVKRGC